MIWGAVFAADQQRQQEVSLRWVGEFCKKAGRDGWRADLAACAGGWRVRFRHNSGLLTIESVQQGKAEALCEVVFELATRAQGVRS